MTVGSYNLTRFTYRVGAGLPFRLPTEPEIIEHANGLEKWARHGFATSFMRAWQKRDRSEDCLFDERWNCWCAAAKSVPISFSAATALSTSRAFSKLISTSQCAASSSTELAFAGDVPIVSTATSPTVAMSYSVGGARWP